jgi:PelA/Pel-15E family pectate lyase
MTNYTPVKSTLCLFFLVCSYLVSAQTTPTYIDKEPFADNTHHWYDIFDKHNVINPLPGKPQYDSTQVTKIANNIVIMQKANGGWAKNYDVFAILTNEQRDSMMAARNDTNTTYDNGNIHSQIGALAIAYTASNYDLYKRAALQGLDFVLNSQYDNGGWPQYYPLQDNYSRCITYNDGVITGIMKVLKKILDNKPEFAFVDKARRDKIAVAYNKGLDCILKTQIIENGKPNGWCQQYNEITLEACWARKFEPPSICNKEGADLVLFLMSIDNPSPALIEAIQHAVIWFNESKILNTRIQKIPAERVVTKYKVSTTDRILVTDSTAPAIWARYYELKTHRPLFCNRDNTVVYSLAEVDRERRDGYGWYVYRPKQVLKAYPAWQKKWDPKRNVLK